jgi:hypothetical protein
VCDTVTHRTVFIERIEKDHFTGLAPHQRWLLFLLFVLFFFFSFLQISIIFSELYCSFFVFISSSKVMINRLSGCLITITSLHVDIESTINFDFLHLLLQMHDS